MTAREALSWGAQALRAAGVSEAGADAQWLLAAALDKPRLEALLYGALTDAQLRGYRDLIARRACREPLQYILGTQAFGDLTLWVGPGVLIPRADTEQIAQAAAQIALRLPPGARCLDLCCGSGAIGLFIAKAAPHVSVCLSDLYDAPLRYARANAQLSGLESRVRIVRSDLFGEIDGRFDLIVSNPPYVARPELDTLEPEVRAREPREALDGGPEGLDFYRRIALESPRCLAPSGILLLEVGAGQADAVGGLLPVSCFKRLEDIMDLSGIRRGVAARYIGN